ncbi:hypothetical protein LZL87_013076 [Fusarium oxysporum]|nr:hypothetical protein LZL87_013076 [Fusarium oxysporum]
MRKSEIISEQIQDLLGRQPELAIGNIAVGFFAFSLRHYPGPKLWAISRISWNYVNMKGRLAWKIRDLHDQYGTVVCIALDELSYTSGAAWKKIYGQRSPEFPKVLGGRDLAFGAPAGCLENADQPWIRVIGARTKSFPWIQLAVQYGLFDFLIWISPRRVTESRNKHLAMTAEKVKRRIQTKSGSKDFFSYILANNQEEKLTEIELTMLASTFIVAGSGTAAGGLAGITYLLLRNPETLEKLKAEIRTALNDEEEITMVSTQSRKYLRTCITEGEFIEGKWVPGGYAVGVNQLAAGHSEVNFHRASEFLPERWLDVDLDSEFASDDRTASQPFSLGSRNCIGKSMANAEMALTFAMLLWNFELELYELLENWWFKQGTFVVWEKLPLLVNLYPRADSDKVSGQNNLVLEWS